MIKKNVMAIGVPEELENSDFFRRILKDKRKEDLVARFDHAMKKIQARPVVDEDRL